MSRPFRRGPQQVVAETDLSTAYLSGRFIQSRTSRTVRRLENKRNRSFISRVIPQAEENTAEQIAQIVSHLKKNGVMVPRLLAVDKENNLVEFERGGKSFERYLDELVQSRKRITIGQRKYIFDAFSKLFRLVGRMHTLGIEHGHPGIQNVLISKNQVGLKDFKYAKWRLPKKWGLARHVINAFEADYRWLILSFMQTARRLQTGLVFRKRIKTLLEKTVRPYPCSPAVKREIVVSLLQNLSDYAS